VVVAAPRCLLHPNYSVWQGCATAEPSMRARVACMRRGMACASRMSTEGMSTESWDPCTKASIEGTYTHALPS